MPAITTAPPISCVAPNVSPSQAQATTVAKTGSRVATIDALVALMCRSEPARSEKVTIVPIDDDERDEHPDGSRVLGEVPLERDVLAEDVPREVPERLDDRPEQRREEEPVERERGRIAVPPLPLRHQEVCSERERATEGRGDADRAERDAAQSSTTSARPVMHIVTATQMRRRDVLLVDEPCEERDEERRSELDQQCDSDREVLDRDEVEPLDESDSDEAERDQEEELPAPDSQAATVRRRAGTRGRGSRRTCCVSARARVRRGPIRGRPSPRCR